MRVATLLCFLATSFMVVALSGAVEYKYLRNERLKEWYAGRTSIWTRDDKIPLIFGEEVLFKEEGECTSIVNATLYIIPLPYALVKEEMSNAVAKKFGIASSREFSQRLDQLYLYDSEESKSYVFEKARDLGIILGNYIKNKIISDPYNQYERSFFGKPKYFSVLEVEIADGRSIFQKPYTLIQVRRKDHWPDWANLHELIPRLPWKQTWIYYIVTRGEVEFIEGFFNHLRPPFVLLYLNNYITSLSDHRFLIRLVSDLDDQLKQKRR
jgi:hypothetical protein